jgi:hypothetical protein
MDLGDRSLETHYRLEYDRPYSFVLADPGANERSGGEAFEVTTKVRLTD